MNMNTNTNTNTNANANTTEARIFGHNSSSIAAMLEAIANVNHPFHEEAKDLANGFILAEHERKLAALRELTHPEEESVSGIREDACPGCGSDLSALEGTWACVGRCGQVWLPGEIH